MSARSLQLWRPAKSAIWTIVSAVCAGGIALVLLLIMGYIIIQGVGALSWSFITELPHPIGVPGGGVANGIVGSLIIVGIAAVMAFPIGMLVGIFVSVYGDGRMADMLRFLSDVLASVPSASNGLAGSCRCCPSARTRNVTSKHNPRAHSPRPCRRP